METLSAIWPHPAVIARNNFVHKSLSCWSYNIAVGCSHACRFCYVPDVSTNKMGPELKALGVKDPDADWGDYVLLRQWDEKKFLASLHKAETTPLSELNPDGNRAVMLCTTTDPYMMVPHPDKKRRIELNSHRTMLVRRALELIRDHSTLNVRILTRSPLAMLDFQLMKTLGNRLLFGMSLPTLDNNLATIYEPHAPAPSKRLNCLRKAKDEGIPLYVAMAPTYPESTDLRATLQAIAALNPLTIFHEPINIRAQNVARIAKHAEELGYRLRTYTWNTPESWAAYAMEQFWLVEELACELACYCRLHLWPDASLKAQARKIGKDNPFFDAEEWFARYWGRISEWPGGVME